MSITLNKIEHQRVCLSLICRDEEKVLPRSIGSFFALERTGVKLGYCIHDGGSEDSTWMTIRNLTMGVQGIQTHAPQPKPLDDFAKARNACLEQARFYGDYIFFLDADDEIVTAPGFKMPRLTADVYDILIKIGTDEFYRPTMVRAGHPCKWVGEMHEYLDPGPCGRERLDGIWIQVHPGEGARSKDPKQKFLDDAAVLTKALEKDPTNLRHMFYLAQSFRDAGMHYEALVAYRKRAQHTEGWDEETFFSLLQIGHIVKWMGEPAENVLSAYLEAFNFRPTRCEPLGYLSEYFRLRQEYSTAVFFANMAMRIPRPNDILFVGADWYDWKAKDEFAICCYWLDSFDASAHVCNKLLSDPKTPDAERKRITDNLNFAMAQIELAKEK